MANTRRGKAERIRWHLFAGLSILAFSGGVVAGLHAAESPWRGNGEQSSAPSADFAVARSLEGWQGLWNSIRRPAPAEFEEGRDMAVLIEAGSRPTAGYRIDLVSAEKRGLFLVVHWREQGPAPDAFVSQVVTHPWLVQRLAKVDGPVAFLKEGDSAFTLPRLEYFGFTRLFPRCAAALQGSLLSGTSLFVVDGGVMAPFLEAQPTCAGP